MSPAATRVATARITSRVSYERVASYAHPIRISFAANCIRRGGPASRILPKFGEFANAEGTASKQSHAVRGEKLDHWSLHVVDDGSGEGVMVDAA
jgi:hypothetical protein